MSMASNATPAAESVPQAAAAQPAAPMADTQKPAQRVISDPREVAAVVMARMKHVSTKKDELALAIDALVDITRQLTRSYGTQLLAVEQLRRRVKALEAAAAGSSEPAPPVQ